MKYYRRITDLPVEIHVKPGETGYEAVSRYIKAFWKNELAGDEDDVVVSMALSYDYKTWHKCNDYVRTFDLPGVEGFHAWENDWWEGEEFIRLYGIATLDSVVDKAVITGGVWDNRPSFEDAVRKIKIKD